MSGKGMGQSFISVSKTMSTDFYLLNLGLTILSLVVTRYYFQFFSVQVEGNEMTHTLTKMSRWFRSGVCFIFNHKVYWGPYNIFGVVK